MPTKKILYPIQNFMRMQAAGGILLLLFSVLAMVWANSPYADAYHLLRERDLLGLTWQIWINDGLMAIFFLFVGLEIKREFLALDRSSRRNAALPIYAALGGMIVPALFYAIFNQGREGAHGWGIPMATDIAFAIGVLSLLGNRVPPSLKVFLTALAVVDDMGAVLVIALFYTENLWAGALAAGLALLAFLYVLNKLRLPYIQIYLAVGAVVWLAFLKSGVHPTIAGVLLAFVIPKHMGERLEHTLNPWVSFFIMPVFALANAGVHLNAAAVNHSVAVGVFIGLVVGKQLGIFSFSWAAVRLGLANLPNRVRFFHVYGAACLGGIGFTMSLFIAGLAFDSDQLLEISKIGIFSASLLSGFWGWVVLRLLSKKRRS